MGKEAHCILKMDGFLLSGMPTLTENDTIEENAALCRQLGLNFVELNRNLPICRLEHGADALRWLVGKPSFPITVPAPDPFTGKPPCKNGRQTFPCIPKG